jgi:hypothetical protein
MATVTGPTPLAFVPPSTSVVLNHAAIDMHAWTYQVSYGDPGNMTQKTVTGPVPLAMQAGMLANAKMAIELAEGWAPGSSTVVP